MQDQLLPAGLHPVRTLRPGDRIITDGLTVTAGMISAFAELTGDRHAIHLDVEAARRQGFGGRVAHGLLVLSLVEGLKSTAPARIDAFASTGWTVTFRRPVLAGDTIQATFRVAGTRRSGAGTWAVDLEMQVVDQAGTLVQRGTTRLFARD